MAKSKEAYFKGLAKEILEFYQKYKNECRREYLMAENTSLKNLYETVEDEDEINLLFSSVSTVVLTANKYEKNILHAHWYQSNNTKIRRIRINLLPQRKSAQETYAYFIKWHHYHILHIEAQVTGSYTVGGIADIIRYVVENPYLYPTTIISLGICFGVNEKRQTLGDTYISDKVYPYFMGAKWDENGFFVSDDHMFRLNAGLRGKIKSEILDTNILNTLDFKTDFGNYITGEAVISNKDVRDLFINTTTQEISAGDMEGYGLFKECCGRNFIIPCLTIKSICDWGVLKNLKNLEAVQQSDEEKSQIDQKELGTVKDSLQAFASFHAYCVLNILLENNVFNLAIQDKLSNDIRHNCKHERIIYFRSIQKYAKEIGQDIFGNVLFPDSFLISMITNLERDKFLFPCDQKKAYEERVWKIKT